MKTNYLPFLSLLGSITCMVSSARAELFTHTDGNLILAFQATGGQGSQQNVFYDLGPAINFRDNGNQGVLANLGASLSNAYGSDWYTRTDLFFGVIGNLNYQPNSGLGSRPVVDGDPSRTVYSSLPTAAPGGALLYPAGAYSSNNLGSVGSNLAGLEAVLRPEYNPVVATTGWIENDPDVLKRGLEKAADGAGVLNQALSQHTTAWDNSWTKWNPTPGAAFQFFTGGVQQNFGKGTSSTYVDIQRILSTNTGASPTGVVGGGTYETTIAISSTGAVSAITAAPASGFTTWIGGFNPPLTNSADRLESADPDNDEIDNLLEFVLNGNPSVSSPNILPTLNATGTDFVFSFTRRADSASEVTQVFEYSTDLVDWTTNPPVTIPSAPGTSGFATVGSSTGTAPNQVQAVTITIPKGANTKLFGRLKAVK